MNRAEKQPIAVKRRSFMEKVRVPASGLAMFATILTGKHVAEVKLRDVHPVTRLWREDQKIGRKLQAANELTAPVIEKKSFGGRESIDSIKAPEVKPLSEALSDVSKAITETGRAEALRQKIDDAVGRLNDGVVAADKNGRFVDGFSGVRSGINEVSQAFGEEERHMNNRKWWDRVLIGLGGGAVVVAPVAEGLYMQKLVSKASKKGNLEAKKSVKKDENGQRRPRWLIRTWNNFTDLSEKPERPSVSVYPHVLPTEVREATIEDGLKREGLRNISK